MSTSIDPVAAVCLRTEKAALRLIARAEQNSSGLRYKLEKRGHEVSCINTVIEKLTSLNLVDDSRYAKFWLQSRLHLARSPRRLLAGLCGRGIPRGEAEAAIKNVLNDETELSLLERFAKKYSRKIKNKRELKIFLKGEGFSAQIIEQFFEFTT